MHYFAELTRQACAEGAWCAGVMGVGRVGGPADAPPNCRCELPARRVWVLDGGGVAASPRVVTHWRQPGASGRPAECGIQCRPDSVARLLPAMGQHVREAPIGAAPLSSTANEPACHAMRLRVGGQAKSEYSQTLTPGSLRHS